MSKTIFISGTWGASDQTEWYHPGSDFHQEAVKQGLDLPKATTPFEWCTGVDGIAGINNHWIAGGWAFLWYCQAHGFVRPNVWTHSDGFQPLAYATSFGLEVNNVVSVAPPVRDDVLKALVRSRIKGEWTNIHTDAKDQWQTAGELVAGEIVTIRREMPLATRNILEPGRTHSGLLDKDLVTARDWWRYCK